VLADGIKTKKKNQKRNCWEKEILTLEKMLKWMMMPQVKAMKVK